MTQTVVSAADSSARSGADSNKAQCSPKTVAAWPTSMTQTPLSQEQGVPAGRINQHSRQARVRADVPRLSHHAVGGDVTCRMAAGLSPAGTEAPAAAAAAAAAAPGGDKPAELPNTCELGPAPAAAAAICACLLLLACPKLKPVRCCCCCNCCCSCCVCCCCCWSWLW